MALHRCEIDAAAGPAREDVLYGRAMLLVRVQMFDGPGVVDALTGEPAAGEDVYTDLRPEMTALLRRPRKGRVARRGPLGRPSGGGPWPSP
jgi:hypothetical protein